MRWFPLIAVAALPFLAGCETSPRAPTDPGICYSVAQKEGQEMAFNVLAREQPQIEACAARLEEMRLNFLRLGGTNRDVVGAYQGRFIFVDRRGISFGQRIDGPRFFALARTGDGRLAVPGAIDFSEALQDQPAPAP